jgi:hypothetical protein
MIADGLAPTAPDEGLASLSSEALEREIGELAAHLNAACCRWLCLVAELDRREGWAAWGAKSCAAWLSWRCGVTPGAAREHVRVARCLAELPRLREAFAAGELSYSKVRAVTRVASAENEADLVELARHATGAQLERLVRSYRGVLAVEDANRVHEERYLDWSWEDDGSLVLRGRLAAEDGALVVSALEAARAQLRSGRTADVSAETRPGFESAAAGNRDGGVSAETSRAPSAEADAQSERPAASNADALVVMAESLLAAGPAPLAGGERCQVIVHVDQRALRDASPDGRCELDDGPALPAETARRLACDAALVTMLERDGRPLTVGRKTRTIPPALRRALHSRDGGCQFPGCAQRRFVDAHHIHHWALGGETRLANLVLLCRRHHRLLHEGGYTAHRQPGRGVIFRRPDGRPIHRAPATRRGDHRELVRRSDPAIGPDVCTPRSMGDRLDYDIAVEGLLARDGLLGIGPAPTARE